MLLGEPVQLISQCSVQPVWYVWCACHSQSSSPASTRDWSCGLASILGVGRESGAGGKGRMG